MPTVMNPSLPRASSGAGGAPAATSDAFQKALATHVDMDGLKAILSSARQLGGHDGNSRFRTGSEAIDTALGGGLRFGALHEIFAESLANEPAAAAFAVVMALRASGDRPVLWVRQDFVGLEMGEVYAPGLVELGMPPERLILVRVRDGPSVLKAGEEAARCASLGAVLIEPWGNPKTLDLTATRRLSLAAARSNVPLFMVRAGGRPTPSASATRWSIRAALSRPFETQAPGHPCFTVDLLKDRNGVAGRSWTVEWNRDDLAFNDIAENETAAGAAFPRGVVSVSGVGSPHDPQQAHIRQRFAG